MRTKKTGPLVQVRRLHRRDLNKVWDFLKRSFRDVNLETVEYQRPRSKKRFFETYEEEGVEQLLFVVDGEIVAYTECTYEILGSDTWINPRYFEKRDMRPLYVEELAVHPDWHGRGVGSFVLEQIQHLAKVRGLTHLVLEVAENNTHAMQWYRKRGFRKLDAAVFMAYAVDVAPELLPPRALEIEQESAPDEQALMAAPVAPDDEKVGANGVPKNRTAGREEAAAAGRAKPGGKTKVRPKGRAKASSKRAGAGDAGKEMAKGGAPAANAAPAGSNVPGAAVSAPVGRPGGAGAAVPAAVGRAGGAGAAVPAAVGRAGGAGAREGAALAGDGGEDDIVGSGTDGKNGQRRLQRREAAPPGAGSAATANRRRPS